MYPIKPLIFCHMQRVLPIAYDPSLSFQELLYKVLDKLNEVVEVTNDTEKIIRETLQEWYESGQLATMLKYRNVYQVTDYGIFPDTGEDLYDKLYYFLEETVKPTGGVVYFPTGTYRISFTICIPENTCFMGCGKNTKIWFDETDTSYGTALTNAGSNIEICHMSIEHGVAGEINTLGTQAGGIGISTVAPRGFYKGDHVYRANAENIYVHDIYSVSKYVLQTEPDPEHTIKHVIVDNIYAPSSLVSWAGGIKEDIHYSNIHCAAIRCGSGADTTINGTIENFETKFLRLSDTGIRATNGRIDGSKEAALNMDSAVVMKGYNFLSDCILIGGVKTYAFTLQSINASENKFGEYFINNCRITDFEQFILNNLPHEEGEEDYRLKIGPCFFNNCYIDNITSSGSRYKGIFSGGKYPYLKPSYDYPRIYNDLVYTPDIVLPEGITTVWNYTRIIGNVIYVRLLLEIPANFSDHSLLFTFGSLGCNKGAHFFCQCVNTNDGTSRPGLLYTTANDEDKGKVFLNNAFGYNRICIDTCMTVYKDW